MLFEESEEKLVKLMENLHALVVCSERFCYESCHEYLKSGTPQNNFIKKINDATLFKISNNPIQGIWSATQSEIVKGKLRICSGRVTEEHRVFFIARHSTQLNKTVVYLIEDDPHHKYNLAKIKANYLPKQRVCGSKEDWSTIFNMIYSDRYVQPLTSHIQPLPEYKNTLPVENPPQETKDSPDNTTPLVVPVFEKMVVECPMQQQTAFNPDTREHPIDQHSELPAVPENKSEAPIKKKKKKKKKPVNAPVSEAYLEIMLQEFLQKSGTEEFYNELEKLFSMPNKDRCLQIVSGLLDLGLNPEITGSNGENLLRIAIMFQHTAVVKLLLDWDVSLLTWGGVDQTVKEQLLIAIKCRDDIEIIKALVKKTKEKGKLNDKLVASPEITILHLAAITGNIAAVQVLMKEGADPEVTDDEGYTPLDRVKQMFYTGDEGAISLTRARTIKPKTDNTLHSKHDTLMSFLTPISPIEKREYNAIKQILSQKWPQPELSELSQLQSRP